MANHLIVSKLKKQFKSRQVVKDISLTLKPGEIIGLLGPNGAGKTTSFYMILGLIASDEGTIQLGNTDITHLPVHSRAQLGIGYLPQEPSIFRKLSVAENILAILETQKDLDPSARENKLNSLLDELSIQHIRDSLGLSLSGGERRRVEIARALATEPKFILLDEPFAGVDPISIIDIKAIINHLAAKNIGVLITDHNVRETLDICHSAYIMNNGTVIASGTPHEVLKHAEVRKVYLGEAFEL